MRENGGVYAVGLGCVFFGTVSIPLPDIFHVPTRTAMLYNFIDSVFACAGSGRYSLG